MRVVTCRSPGCVGRPLVALELQYEPVLALPSRSPTGRQGAMFWRETAPEPSRAQHQGRARTARRSPRPAPHLTSTYLVHPRRPGAHKGAARDVRAQRRWGPWALRGCWSCCWQAPRRRPRHGCRRARAPTKWRGGTFPPVGSMVGAWLAAGGLLGTKGSASARRWLGRWMGQQGLPVLKCCSALTFRGNGPHGASMFCRGHWSAERGICTGAAAWGGAGVSRWHKIAPSPRGWTGSPGRRV